MERYEAKRVEEKWQRLWAEARAFNIPNPDSTERAGHRRKTYMLEMLPYASGELHMGHVRNYMLGEVVAHFRRRHIEHERREARAARSGATWPPASPASESAFGSTTPMCVRV